MSLKVNDGKGRWRNKTVAFRMSPEEAEQLDTLAGLSGLTKQDYLVRKVLNKEISILPNPRVFKALRNQLVSVLDELRRLESVSVKNDELLDVILYIAEILDGIKGTINEVERD